MPQEIDVVRIKKDDETQIILGHAGFIKTVEDLYEAMMNVVPNAKFGIAFSEASGARLIRSDGNDHALTMHAERILQDLASGHTFVILFKDAFPINVLNSIKHVNEVATIYCATANDVEVVLCKTTKGNAIIGIIDGSRPVGVEKPDDKERRKKLIRDMGYKR